MRGFVAGKDGVLPFFLICVNFSKSSPFSLAIYLLVLSVILFVHSWISFLS